jgi:hypothetical protein
MRKLMMMTLAIVLAGTAVAGSGRFVATLAQPVATNQDIFLEGNIFRCEASTCVLISESVAAETIGVCHALKRKVGPLTAYVAAGKPFDAGRLGKCNS